MLIKTVCLPLLLLALLIMPACTTSQVVSTLEAIVTAAEVAIPVIGPMVGVPAPVTTMIVGYLQQVNIAAAQVTTILAGPGTPAQKTADVIKAFAGVAAGCNCLPPGLPTTIVNVINAVGNAVSNFLANFVVAPTIKTAAAVAPKPIKISSADKTKLDSIRTRAEANLAALKGVK